jgi:hypothetical protein
MDFNGTPQKLPFPSCFQSIVSDSKTPGSQRRKRNMKLSGTMIVAATITVMTAAAQVNQQQNQNSRKIYRDKH